MYIYIYSLQRKNKEPQAYKKTIPSFSVSSLTHFGKCVRGPISTHLTNCMALKGSTASKGVRKSLNCEKDKTYPVIILILP